MNIMNFFNTLLTASKYFIYKDKNVIYLLDNSYKTIMIAKKNNNNNRVDIFDCCKNILNISNYTNILPNDICNIINKYSLISVNIGYIEYISKFKRIFKREYVNKINLYNKPNQNFNIIYNSYNTQNMRIKIYNNKIMKKISPYRTRYNVTFLEEKVIDSVYNFQILLRLNKFIFLEMCKIGKHFYAINLNNIPLEEAFCISVSNLL